MVVATRLMESMRGTAVGTGLLMRLVVMAKTAVGDVACAAKVEMEKQGDAMRIGFNQSYETGCEKANPAGEVF